MSTPSRTRLTRQQSQEQTRYRLIESACSQIAKHGFGGASVRDIAEAAGYSQGAFYSNFESKEALLLEIVKLHKVEEAERITAIIDASGNDFEAAMAGLEAWAEQFAISPDQAMLISELQLHTVRSPEFGAAYEVLMAEQRALYAKIVGRLFNLSGTTPPRSLEDIAGELMALARSIAIDKALGAGSGSGIFSIVLRALLQKQKPIPAS